MLFAAGIIVMPMCNKYNIYVFYYEYVVVMVGLPIISKVFMWGICGSINNEGGNVSFLNHIASGVHNGIILVT